MRRLLPIGLPVGLLLSACTAAPGTGPSASEGDGLVSRVPGGKADDYYSDVAAEFEVHGQVPVEVPAGADDDAKREAAQRRLDAVVLYLTTYVTKKIDGFFSNLDYGGHAAMVRNRTAETLELIEDPEGETGLAVRFAVDVAGPPELPTILGESFEVRMPAGATSDGEGSLGTVRGFDPDRYDGELEAVPCELRSIPAARNGYPEYTELFADGVFDITLFQGHDYNDARSDLIETLQLFYTLEVTGFDTESLDYLDEPDATVLEALRAAFGDEAETYADLIDRVAKLHAGSGPLVKTLHVGDREIRAEARLFHSEMFRTDRAGQRELALAELVGRDVFFYNGHAGPWYGFYLDAAGAAEIEEDDFASADFTERQQLVIANGCQTYSQYADVLYAHPAKNEGNLDVITTVNYSYGRGSDMLVAALTQTDEAGQHIAWSYGDLIRAFNEDSVNADEQVFYGVTGIDENPKLHPRADTSVIGQPCMSSEDCGNPYGNVCDGACGVMALSAEACPEGSTYADFATDGTIIGGACWSGG